MSDKVCTWGKASACQQRHCALRGLTCPQAGARRAIEQTEENLSDQIARLWSGTGCLFVFSSPDLCLIREFPNFCFPFTSADNVVGVVTTLQAGQNRNASSYGRLLWTSRRWSQRASPKRLRLRTNQLCFILKKSVLHQKSCKTFSFQFVPHRERRKDHLVNTAQGSILRRLWESYDRHT